MRVPKVPSSQLALQPNTMQNPQRDHEVANKNRKTAAIPNPCACITARPSSQVPGPNPRHRSNRKERN